MTEPITTPPILPAEPDPPLFGPVWCKDLNLKENFCIPAVSALNNQVPQPHDLEMQSSGPVLDPSCLIDPTDPIGNPPVPGNSSYGNTISALVCCVLSAQEIAEMKHLPHASVTYSEFSRNDIATLLVCASSLTTDGVPYKQVFTLRDIQQYTLLVRHGPLSGNTPRHHGQQHVYPLTTSLVPQQQLML
jgi:hypothetical protein